MKSGASRLLRDRAKFVGALALVLGAAVFTGSVVVPGIQLARGVGSAAEMKSESARIMRETFLPPSELADARSAAVAALPDWPSLIAAVESHRTPEQIFISGITASGSTITVEGQATHDKSYSLTAVAKFLAALREDPHFAGATLARVEKENFGDASSSSPFEVVVVVDPSFLRGEAMKREAGGEPIFDSAATPPPAPSELHASTTFAADIPTVTLSWVGDGAHFFVFGGERAEDLKLLGKTTEHAFGAQLRPGQESYTFAVRSESAEGAISPASAPLDVIPGGREPPPAVANLKVKREAATGFSGEAGFWVDLSWDPVTMDDFRTYRVYFGSSPDALRQLGETAEPHFGFFTPQVGEQYFRVVAVDDAGNETK